VTRQSQESRFWTTMPGVLTAVAGVVTAATGLLITLDQVRAGDSGPPSDGPAGQVVGTSSPRPTPSEDAAAHGIGDPLAGTWRGAAASVGGGDPFDVELRVEAPCRLREPCGTISVSSAPCTGRVTLWTVSSQTFEFYVDRFTPESSSDCSPGAGDFFELRDDGTLRYTTDYSDTVGVLEDQAA
jgi:hypothetical protein